MVDIDKAGFFYLGKIVNPITDVVTDDLLFYDSKNLTTHAVCVGMTGSGKTGLGIALLEEAALNHIPAIIIDPKGDLANLLLTFPELSIEEFLPWIDFMEAKKKGMSDQEYAESLALTWKDGLLSSFEDKSRIKKLKESVDMTVYTPASNAGVSLSVLSSFKAPDPLLREDLELMRERVLSLTSSLLGLLQVEADPINSREHIMISAVIDQAFEKGEDLDIAKLIREIQHPSFDRLGALDIETFFPEKDRLALAIRLNALLASKSFQAWTIGEPLQIEKLLWTEDKKPKFSIISIAHLADPERMFFVTLLLGEFISWMRKQPGSSSLKAILYMDEIFGFFPPTAMPPSKLPMLTLLKTARAYGVGVFLSTQNPVDLDYKGLANCGTWFIGKLQTERDKARVLEGLRVASNGELSSSLLDQMMSRIKKRTFIMRSIHEKEPKIFMTRWTMSYLKGPLTLVEIEKLTDKQKKEQKLELKISKQAKPFVPKSIPEYFINPVKPLKNLTYQPYILATANLHFVDSKNKVDLWKDVSELFPIDSLSRNISLKDGKKFSDDKETLAKEPIDDSSFEDLPAFLIQEKNLSLFQKAFISSLYQNETLTLFEFPELKMISNQDETKSDFEKRAESLLNEKRLEEIQELEKKYLEKFNVLSDRLRRADEKVAIQKQQSLLQKFEAFISIMTTFLAAFFGKRLTKGTISQVGTSMRRAGRVTKESKDVAYAEENVESYEEKIEELKKDKERQVEKIISASKESLKSIREVNIKPRKSDLLVDKIAIVWRA